MEVYIQKEKGWFEEGFKYEKPPFKEVNKATYEEAVESDNTHEEETDAHLHQGEDQPSPSRDGAATDA